MMEVRRFTNGRNIFNTSETNVHYLNMRMEL